MGAAAGLFQGSGRRGQRQRSFLQHPAQPDEVMRQAALQLQLHVHMRGAQAVGAGQALVDQRLALGQNHAGWRHAVRVIGFQ